MILFSICSFGPRSISSSTRRHDPVPTNMSTIDNATTAATEPAAQVATANQPCDPEGQDLMNPQTFSPPSLDAVGPNVYIEYCDRVSLAPGHERALKLTITAFFLPAGLNWGSSTVSMVNTTNNKTFQIPFYFTSLPKHFLSSFPRRAPRATWIQTELFLTFPTPTLGSITILPSIENAGRFRVWLNNLPEGSRRDIEKDGVVWKEDGWVLVWDRKVESGFPEVSPILSHLVPSCPPFFLSCK
jgi:predicted Rdx family selenoprotein